MSYRPFTSFYGTQILSTSGLSGNAIWLLMDWVLWMHFTMLWMSVGGRRLGMESGV
ncbi:hypothetical protein BDZ45DRAFT_670463 [Acephala macrosclerotiorum]|nr:hypothetical protein BDZ45DRAFT_670463 [Acephala macrosclerotiorum]